MGIASGIRNVALLRATADSRARAEVAKVLDSYVSVLNKDYQASTTAGDMKSSSEEQHVSQAMKSFSQAELQGVQIIDRYLAADGTQYALAEMDLQQIKDGLSKMKELNQRVRDAVRANADKAFDELDAQPGARKAAATPTPPAPVVALQTAPPPREPPSPPPPAADPPLPPAAKDPPPAPKEPPPPPPTASRGDCLAQDDANPIIRGCVIALKASDEAVVVTVELTNKLDRHLAVIADGRHLGCGADLTDRRGNSYAAGYGCPGSLPVLKADPAKSGTAASIIHDGQPMRGKLPLQRQYTFVPVKGYQAPESWTMELDLLVTNPERSEDSKVHEVQFAFQNIPKSR